MCKERRSVTSMENHASSNAANAVNPELRNTSAPASSASNAQEASNAPKEFVDNEDSDDDELDSMMQDGELKDLSGPLSKSQADKIGLSIYAELKQAAYEARYLSMFLALLSVLISYQLFIAPYPLMDKLDKSLHIVNQDFGLIRPVLTDHQQRVLRENARDGETNFVLPETADHLAAQLSEIKVRFHQQAKKEGVHKPPDMFYNGVMFGITDQNSHNHRYTERNAHEAVATKDTDGRVLMTKPSVEVSLNEMRPKPTHIVRRQVQNNATGWMEEGFGVYFAYNDLAAQGKLSSDKLKPWKRVLEDMLNIAREHRQVYVTAWYPHEYGHAGESVKHLERLKENPHVFTTILQQVIPTRTGLNGIVSTVPVWMSAVNKAAPARKLDSRFIPEIRKDWKKEDHWDHYKPGGKKYVKYTDDQLKEMKYKLFDGVKGIERHAPNDMIPSQVEALAAQAVNDELKARYLKLVGGKRRVLDMNGEGSDVMGDADMVDFNSRYSNPNREPEFHGDGDTGTGEL